MPPNFGQTLQPAELDALVKYLDEVTASEGTAMTAKLRAPGWYRAGAFIVLGVLFAAALVTAIRQAYGFSTPFDGSRRLGRQLAGRGADRLAARGAAVLPRRPRARSTTGSTGPPGRPTRPEDHSSHGATSWRDYFRVNTDHKVIGIQYVVTSFFFMLVGGLLAMLVRAELAAPGSQFVDANAYNGLFSVHASLMIFLFIIPVFAGLANFVLPLMIGAPDMAFPRLNALSFWMLPVAGLDDDGVVLRPGRLVRDRLDGVRAALDRRCRSGSCSSRSASSSRARRRSRPR